MHGRWDPVNDAIQQALTGITLADMQEASVPRAFRIPACRFRYRRRIRTS